MDDIPFYLKGTGKLIVDSEDLYKFKNQNPDLTSYVDKYEFNDRTLDFDLLRSFCYWIIGQQISVYAAKCITDRFLELVVPLTTENLLSTPNDKLRSVGLSRSKSEYIHNIARFIQENQDDPRITESEKYTSDELRRYFTQIRGVGPWTVNMHLIFILGKLDVYAIGDLVVRKGIQLLYNLDEIPNEKYCKENYSWGDRATVGTLLSWRVLGE